MGKMFPLNVTVAPWTLSLKMVIESTKQLVRDRVFEVCMEYDGIDEHTGFYRFIPMKHKGDAYHGCSGAPIAEPTGKIVGLLQGGREEEGVILGVPLKTFIAYLPVKE